MFEWDEEKSRRNLVERGFDFTFASRVFLGDPLERDDDRRDYGERRIEAVGEASGLVLVVVYTWRGERRRVISARRANRKERSLYRDRYRVSRTGPEV